MKIKALTVALYLCASVFVPKALDLALLAAGIWLLSLADKLTDYAPTSPCKAIKYTSSNPGSANSNWGAGGFE